MLSDVDISSGTITPQMPVVVNVSSYELGGGGRSISRIE